MRICFPFALAVWFPALLSAEVSFEESVLPIMEKSCFQCHSAPGSERQRKQPKAGLRLDAAWAILAGSNDGSVITAGDSKGSELFRRVSLPADHRDVMPPTKKRRKNEKEKLMRLSKSEIKAIQQWIDEGADFGKWEGNLEGKPNPEKSSAGEPGKPLDNRATTYTSDREDRYTAMADQFDEISDDAWASVTEAGGRVERLTKDSPLLSVDFRLSLEDATDQAIASIASIAEYIVHLDLSGTGATEQSFALLGAMPNLVRLDLSETAAGDESLSHLTQAEDLRYLNLYSTEVSDTGLRHLQSLPKLESLYLWQSNVTPKGVEQLEIALPNAKISFR